jgi:hypothetical protein
MKAMKAIAAASLSSVLLSGGGAQAAPVLMDFEGGLPVFVRTNLVLNGFRVSPFCHFDFQNFFGRNNNTGIAMGFDMSGCLDPGSTNANYLGAGVAGAANTLVFIDLGGILFDLLSLNGTTDLTVLSSNGGSFSFPLLGPPPLDNEAFRPQNFTGAQWTGLQWIAFQGGGGGAPTTPLDNIRFNVNAVPEPTTLALLAMGLAAAGWRRRHQGRGVVG